MKGFLRKHKEAAAAVVLFAALALFVSRTIPRGTMARQGRHGKRRQAVLIRRPATVQGKHPPPPIYGPPSPSPIYGPPSPPSRVPLLSVKESRRSRVYPVSEETVRTAGHEAELRLRAWGWDRLDLSRGIPFYDAEAHRARRPVSRSSVEGLWRQQSEGDQSRSVVIVYCIDTAFDEDAETLLRSVRQAVLRAAAELRNGDRFAIVTGSGKQRVVMGMQEVTSNGSADAATTALDSLAPSPDSTLAATLCEALSIPGCTHVIVIAPARAPRKEEPAAIEQCVPLNGTSPKIVSLVVGEGTATPRAAALRNVAIRTQGAFAWLRRARREGAP